MVSSRASPAKAVEKYCIMRNIGRGRSGPWWANIGRGGSRLTPYLEADKSTKSVLGGKRFIPRLQTCLNTHPEMFAHCGPHEYLGTLPDGSLIGAVKALI